MMARLRLVSIGVLLAQFHAPQAWSENGDRWTHAPYELGQGLNFPQIGVNVGGYLSLRYRDVEDAPSTLSLKDLSLLLSADVSDRVNLFTEAEIGEAVSVARHGIDSKNAEFEFERLYADYRARQHVTLRVGKFLTPVGRWNLIHADPLVWTVSRPLTTSVSFARQAAGAMVYGSVPLGDTLNDNGLDYSVFVDDTDLLDRDQQEELAYEDANPGITAVGAFEHAAGAHVTYHLLDDRMNLGASYLRYRMADLHEDKDLLGVDFFWNLSRIELSSEWVYRNSRGGAEPDERGGFVQAAVPVAGHMYAIGRYEHYTTAVQPERVEVETLGLTYRPHRAISAKLEYRDGDHNRLVAPSGWLASIAVLF
ncbi:MAG: hypothetical protein HY941_06590 [Gammaproteobacteria bacterium]|nr:hypothetical protein [Gammaproteobacteria bacterium]